ncbi:MAG: hypothetical protein ACP5N5_05330 [Desulfurococcus sp.]
MKNVIACINLFIKYSRCAGSFIATGSLGASLHVLLDAPLYSDIKPFIH